MWIVISSPVGSESAVEIKIQKDLEKHLKGIVSNSGIDLRRSLNLYGLKRFQLDIRKGILKQFDWNS